MDSFNRTLLVGLAALGAVLWLVAMVVALFFFPGAAGLAGEIVAFMADNTGLYLRLMFAAVFAVLALVSVLIVLVAYSPPQSTRAVALPRVPGGIALLSPEAIAQYVGLGLADLPGVARVQPQVKPHGQAMDVSVEVHTLPGVDLVNKTAQVHERVRRTVTQELGLALGRLQVFYQLDMSPPPEANPPPATS
ncbi:MAG: hypothetical protein HYY01_07530 [Chloroflexi bacterium]|nr:hypothetical protein [Chloroflexota bacterium]